MSHTHPPDILRGRYHLTEHLGSGGMATVYRATDTTLNREVAIKFLAASQIGKGEAGQRFLREARSVARLSHPNVMTLYDADREGEWHYLVLEYIPGTDLHRLMAERGGPLPAAEAVQVIAGVLNALAYAHGLGLIHRDIKPENIMITPDGAVKVTDFGLALAADDIRLTDTQGVVGTVLYMAPEVLAGGQADPRSDLYGAGAVLYEMLTGQPPFMGDNQAQIITQILNAPVHSPRLSNPAILPDLEHLILRLLDKDPAARYSTAEDCLAALPDPAALAEPPADALQAIPRPPASRLERIVRGSSAAHRREAARRPEAAGEPEDETLLPADPVAGDLLVYAAQEDTAEAVEAERRHLARLLGETVIGQINLLLAQANAYEMTLGANAPAKMAVSVLTTIARQALQQARDLESRLHPAALDTLGLEPALESLANQELRMRGLQVILALQRLRERLPGQIELALFRAAQDAIDRATREAHASQVVIQLEKSETELRFILSDNGLPPLGEVLRTACQRVEALGGRVEVGLSRTGGLELAIRFPVEEPVELSERELEVLAWVAAGMTNKQIAEVLVISPRTVKFHLDNVFGKLGVSTRTEAAIIALRRGWVRPGPPETL